MKIQNISSKLLNIIIVIGMVLGLLSGFSFTSKAYAEDKNATASPTNRSLPESETGLYIVQLSDPSLARYQGGIVGLAATSPEVTGSRRLDTSTQESQAYLNYLDAQQNELLGNLETAFGHPIEVAFQYKNVLNAVAVRISHEEALQAFNLAGVRNVFPDTLRSLETDIGPTLIGAPSIWTGATMGNVDTFGEGIIIGMIDSGINHAHPSFADVGGDGYDHTNPNGSGNYVGWCVANPTFCNDKLIGAHNLYTPGTIPEDTAGHGSHTASTAGGNSTDVLFDDGAGGTFTVTISGVAPHANLIAYKVCDPSCPSTASVAAVDLAITENVDVLNYSISGGDDPWNDSVDLAFLDAFAAGIFVSASAGNDGPDAGTVAKTGPWNAAVAASTHSRLAAHPVDVVTDSGSLMGLGALEGSPSFLTADLTAPIIWGGDVITDNINGCTAWTGTPFAGAIGMVQRGSCTFATKINNLEDAGAIGALVYNNVGGPPITMGMGTADLPAMMITLNNGLAVVDLISGDSSAMATLHKALTFVYDNNLADVMAGFSSRGPSQWDLLKPDYTAPGVNILAAVAAADGDPVQYDFYQGTSMSSPHGAGSAALMMALRPTWSPAEIKSAIASTADQTVFDSDGITPADPFDMGSGRIDLSKAAYAGFVLNETTANYVAANPDTGGQPNTLNQPSMVDLSCVGTCSWERTIKSTLPYSQEWTVSVTSGLSMTLEASPLVFTLASGASQTIVITANVTAGLVGEAYFGDVVLTPTAGADPISVGHLTVVAAPATSSLPELVDIITYEHAGTKTIYDVQAMSYIVDLTADVAGLSLGERHELSLNQDPTNGDPFDDLDDVFWTTFNVPEGTLRLVAEVVISEASDVDLFVGTGTTPSLATTTCISATGVWDEYCNLDNPDEGDWWVLVQNWEGSNEQPDRIVAVTAKVAPVDADNMTITGPNSVPAGDPFDLDVNWNEPSMEGGDYWYGQFALGTEPSHPGNLGYVNVNLDFLGTIITLPIIFKQ